MNASCEQQPAPAQYELRFSSLHREGRGYAFPCDARGQVDLDELPTRERNSYFFARACVGREFSMPSVHVARFDGFGAAVPA